MKEKSVVQQCCTIIEQLSKSNSNLNITELIIKFAKENSNVLLHTNTNLLNFLKDQREDIHRYSSSEEIDQIVKDSLQHNLDSEFGEEEDPFMDNF